MAISLNLPMIFMKSKEENRDFFEVLDYYMNMISNIHERTIEYTGNMVASVNPIMFCEGGLHGGHLKPNEKIAPVLKAATVSFGVCALPELQKLYNGKDYTEDNDFAYKVISHIAKRKDEFTEKTGHNYAIYSTPELSAGA